MSSTMSKKDQYHHFIPRFILREFQAGNKRSNKERQEEFRKTGVVNERIYFFDMQTHTLENRLIGTVYGVTNLYRDITTTQHVDEVEEKFSKLESHNARLFQDLHKRLDGSASERRSFPITRKDLGQLRKFLFLMHFRNSGLQGTYFDPEHPDHRSLRDVLEKRWAQAPAAKTSRDVWLHAMKYYLDTPHSQILLQVAARAPGNDIIQVLKRLNPHTIENADLMDAITYHQQADLYHLSIVQAAPGHEFVLGNNTFGLWEGFVGSDNRRGHGVHRIYVASPRIALILRLNMFLVASPELRADTTSDLLSIPLAQPKCTFCFTGNESFIDMARYRASPEAQNDLFTFPITIISPERTFLINMVVMQNVGLLGSLTFKGPSCMRITLRRFWRLNNHLNRFMRLKYSSLMTIVCGAIHGQPEEFDAPLSRVFIPSASGGEATMTTVEELSKMASRKKKKGKGKNSQSLDKVPIPISVEAVQTPPASPSDRIMTLVTKRIQGVPLSTRERYKDSLEGWNLMYTDTNGEEPHPYRTMFHLTADRFKKLGEPLLHLQRKPGFCPTPDVRFKESPDIASDETIKAIFDGGGKWFDKWDEKFGLHIAEGRFFEEMTGIRNTRHLLRDLLIIEVVTWLARSRNDILRRIVVPNLDLSLYLTSWITTYFSSSTLLIKPCTGAFVTLVVDLWRLSHYLSLHTRCISLVVRSPNRCH